MILKDCAPPHIKYPVECGILLTECNVVIYSAIAASITGDIALPGISQTCYYTKIVIT